MNDRDEIIDTLNLYALAVDSQQWKLFDRVFTPDSDVDFGSNAHWTDLEQFKTDFAAFHDPFDATQHMMTNHQVRVAGDTANTLTYGSWRLVRHDAADDQGNGPLWDGTGWYDDQWARTEDGWRIVKRVCRVIWFTGNDRVRETLAGVTFEDENTTLRAEADADRLAYFKAI